MTPATFITGSNAFTFESVTYVPGLIWFTEPGLSKKAAENRARIDGGASGKDAYITRLVDSKTTQFALVSVAETSRKSAAFSIAACLAAAGKLRKFPATWAGAFSLGSDRFIYILIREGAIVSDGDQVVSRDVAEQLLNSARANSVEAIICSPDIDFDGANKIDLSTFLSVVKKRTHAEFRITRPGDKAASSVKFIVIPLLLLCAIGAAIAGWYWWEAEQAKAAAKLAEMRAREAAAKKGATKLVIPAPEWEGRPLPESVLTACWNSVQAAERVPAGWQWVDTVCTEKTIVHKYTRPALSGSVGALLRILPDATVEESGVSATVSPEMPRLPNAPAVTLLSPDIAKSQFLAAAQQAFTQFTLGPSQAPPLPPPKPGELVQTPSWKLRKFTVDGLSSDQAALRSTLKVPGARITTVSITSANRTKIEGNLYAN